MKRYPSFDYETIPLEECEGLLEFIAEEEQEEKVWQRWVMRYQMQMGYREFKEQLIHSAKKDEPVDQIEVLKKVKGILDTIREDDA